MHRSVANFPCNWWIKVILCMGFDIEWNKQRMQRSASVIPANRSLDQRNASCIYYLSNVEKALWGECLSEVCTGCLRQQYQLWDGRVYVTNYVGVDVRAGSMKFGGLKCEHGWIFTWAMCRYLKRALPNVDPSSSTGPSPLRVVSARTRVSEELCTAL